MDVFIPLWLFQFTHPGGVRLHKPLRTPSGTLFQFTHPGGVRLGGLCLRSCSIACFNSRTREGCDTIKPSDYVANWEFQFTHPGGVRLTDISLTLGDIRFNSRTREGCDVKAVLRHQEQAEVSIHAPGRGATARRWLSNCGYPVSIHAPGRGATVDVIDVPISVPSFNSRTREGCDFSFSCTLV